MEFRMRLLCVAIFCLVLAFYTSFSVQKYLDRKVTICNQRLPYGDTIPYPSITICSGFKNDSITPARVASAYQDSDEKVVDIQALLGKSAVSAMSYDKEDFISYFTQAKDDVYTNNMLENDQVWDEDFHEYYGGRCATYNPNLATKPGQTNSILIGLKWPPRDSWGCNNYTQKGCFYYTAIFLHPKNGFIYNKGNEFRGKTMIYPEENKQVIFNLHRKEFILLNKDFERCDPQSTIPKWKKCIYDAYDKIAGCSFPWRPNQDQSKLPVCTIRQVHERLSSIEHHTWWDVDSVVANATGCLKPCTYEAYDLIKLERLPSDEIPQNWVFPKQTKAVVMLYYVNTVKEVIEEFVAYDGFSLVGEVGGALGLFLGWSCINVLELIFRLIAEHGVKCYKTKKQPKK